MNCLKKLVAIAVLTLPLSGCLTAREPNECAVLIPPHLMVQVQPLEPLPDRPLTQTDIAQILLMRQQRDKLLIAMINQWQEFARSLKVGGSELDTSSLPPSSK